MSDTKLKPCPFCGGEADMIEQKHREYPSTYYVRCKGCHCKSLERVSIGIVIDFWNTRKPIDRIVEQLEEAKEQIAKEDYCRTKHFDENDCEHKDCFKCCAEHLIKIVKAGGIDKQPITCKDCRQYPCRNTNEALETCDEFEWW